MNYQFISFSVKKLQEKQAKVFKVLQKLLVKEI